VEQRTSLHIVDCDENHAKGVAFNMLFMVWRYHTTAAAYRRGIVAAMELSRRYPEGIGVCQFLGAEAMRPEADARAALVDLLRMSSIRHFSVTYEGTGFRAAAIRAVISGAHTLGRPKFPHTVQVTLAAAARWHAEHQSALGRPETAHRIERAALELRRIQLERHPTLPGAAPR
jgi:hypothetical protein